MVRSGKALRCRHRLAREPELAIVVIFKDGDVVLAGPAQQIETAVEAQHRTKRELVRWRQKNCARFLRSGAGAEVGE